ncbi:TIGR02996 domain-containing protein [Frigoriglobus tundricola]|uniref:TIGR02996 domain-containing protein n=1 Tax=Frigoriglobus tundricola TaxID=2774151 RepID=A0A6M5YKK0_9BACT|nr:TIGR02996 domain-containing protein [Frigoriglobus tundricola]QJW94609.1 hypothetical protein FTUN_2131 [Frigoriglobus tundricola]
MAKRRANNEPLCSEHEALLSAIIQFPDEDTPRLVFADWLDEHGDHDRAEFIRLQIRLAAARADDTPYDFPSELRAAELYKRNRAEWKRDFRGRGVELVSFERGFVTAVSATADAFVRCGELWCRRHPLGVVIVTKVIGRIERLLAAPHLDAIGTLQLRDEFEDEHLFALTDAPRPGGAGRFPNLEGLGFVGDGYLTGIGTGGVAALAGWEMPRLRELYLGDTQIDNHGAAAVTEAPWFGNLSTLTFETCRIGDAGLAALLSSPRQNLSFLELARCRVTARGLHALADMPGGPTLKNLCLEENPIRSVNVDRLGAVLRKHPSLGLNLRDCPIPRSTRAKLVERFGDRVWFGRGADDVPDLERIHQLGTVAEAWGK